MGVGQGGWGKVGGGGGGVWTKEDPRPNGVWSEEGRVLVLCFVILLDGVTCALISCACFPMQADDSDDSETKSPMAWPRSGPRWPSRGQQPLRGSRRDSDGSPPAVDSDASDDQQDPHNLPVFSDNSDNDDDDDDEDGDESVGDSDGSDDHGKDSDASEPPAPLRKTSGPPRAQRTRDGGTASVDSDDSDDDADGGGVYAHSRSRGLSLVERRGAPVRRSDDKRSARRRPQPNIRSGRHKGGGGHHDGSDSDNDRSGIGGNVGNVGAGAGGEGRDAEGSGGDTVGNSGSDIGGDAGDDSDDCGGSVLKPLPLPVARRPSARAAHRRPSVIVMAAPRGDGDRGANPHGSDHGHDEQAQLDPMAGWLWKKGHGSTWLFGRRNWKRRWFLLDGPTLSYHKSERLGQKSLGVIDMTTATVCDVLGSKHAHYFQVRPNNVCTVARPAAPRAHTK